MQTLFLTIARFALSAWIGAAALFVVTSVREVLQPTFDSMIKNQLAAVRFPPYYLFGFTLVAVGIVGGLIGLRGVTGRWRFRFFAGTSLAALLLMVIDYVVIFQPLYATVTRPDGLRDEKFMRLHEASTHINAVDVTLCLIAAVLVCWPTSRETASRGSADSNAPSL